MIDVVFEDLRLFLILCDWLKKTNDGKIVYFEQTFIEQNFFHARMAEYGRKFELKNIVQFLTHNAAVIIAKYHPEKQAVELKMNKKVFDELFFYHNEPWLLKDLKDQLS